MRKLVFFNAISVDGYFAGPDGEIGWQHVDEATNAYAAEQALGGGGLIFGRVTYELMHSFWPTPAGREMDPVVSAQMTRLPKYVFSRTLDEVTWANTTLFRDDPAGRIARLKEETGGVLAILGSANLASSLHGSGLIDEYHLLVNPLVLGGGRRLFEELREPLALRLCDTHTFPSGVVLLRYERAR